MSEYQQMNSDIINATRSPLGYNEDNDVDDMIRLVGGSHDAAMTSPHHYAVHQQQQQQQQWTEQSAVVVCAW